MVGWEELANPNEFGGFLSGFAGAHPDLRLYGIGWMVGWVGCEFSRMCWIFVGIRGAHPDLRFYGIGWLVRWVGNFRVCVGFLSGFAGLIPTYGFAGLG